MANMDLLDQQIGRRLQLARRKAGFRSARAFAKHHGIPESTYSQHETGKRSLNPKTTMNYCQILKITAGWLIAGEEKGSAPAFQQEQPNESVAA